ncbi:MAG: nodulation protein NfeD [Armatimonadetes bacterium]|nr:nodulation protein NfeD [Armatimonadota bacterium]NIM24567.1 nodulation protein NfeD [Armatimonadota bacterium]NIM68443.1 nodulation protein NfeD [Armatimonadota bacterium]NIM76829.1 nodulation protein NfeD [Armatimonadota bacterium]NIN06640.1 nodulation protein NfeD [Armatimonadota bacterium]
MLKRSLRALRRIRIITALGAIALALYLLAGFVDAGSTRPVVYRAEIKGVINPFGARYLERAIRETERAGAAALILVLDTPGGLDTAMRSMIQAELNAHVPVIVYVAPSGARAASAGMFITLAGHLAAMAPGTAIGAAHPVSITGGGEQGEVMEAKITEDAAAMARSIAAHRERNVAWAESAVRDSVSITASEAKEKGVIEIIAASLDDLLNQAHGRSVKTPAGATVLSLQGAEVKDLPMGFVERLFHIIAEPNIAYILLTLGTLGLIVEFYNPGGLLPGIAGAICLLLGLAALGTLPIGWAGVALLALALALLIAELHAPGFGAFGVGALIAFLAGSLLLFVPITPPSPAAPVVRVSPWLIGTMTALFGGVILLVAQRVWAAQRLAPQTGQEALIGVTAEVISPIAPEGTVRVRGEVWSARSEGGSIAAGASVQVERIEGVVLVVRPATAQKTEQSPA